MKRLFALVIAAAGLALPQAADYANQRYRTKEGREAMAKTLGSHDREQTQKPEELVAALKIAAGSTVADIGTGVGFMLPYLTKAVGPKGKVVAEDIFPDFLDKARVNAKEKALANVDFVLGTEKDPKLPNDKVDLALILDAYHHFDFPAEMLAGIHRGLKSGGRLAIVEFYQKGFTDPKHIRFDEDGLVKEITAHGFEFVSMAPFIEGRQFLALFRRK